MSALGAANSSLFSAARYCMTGARYGFLPEIFACIQKNRLTPITGIILEVRILLLVLFCYPAFHLQGLLAILLCLPSNIEGLIDFFSFTAWIFYGLTFLATLVCKFTKKNVERVISVSLYTCVYKLKLKFLHLDSNFFNNLDYSYSYLFNRCSCYN